MCPSPASSSPAGRVLSDSEILCDAVTTKSLAHQNHRFKSCGMRRRAWAVHGVGYAPAPPGAYPSRSMSDVFPSLRYRDAPAAIEWLERAFGFQRRVVYQGEDGRVEHAEVAHGDGRVMLGSERAGEEGRH